MRVERPHSPYFRYTGPGVLQARPAAIQATTTLGRAWSTAKRVLIGRPLATEEEGEERLTKKKALAIFSSDAISSSAYSTEEILRVLVLAGASALFLSFPIAIAIALLLAVVSTSYRQIARAYPSGGGDYAVAQANLGRLAALIVGGSLLVDYILTVAVSTSSAVEQIVSAVPQLEPVGVQVGLVAIALMTLGNLRGIRESGNIFAVPTYLFLVSALIMIGIGLYRHLVLGEGAVAPVLEPAEGDPLGMVGIFLILRAFASGSVALTGTEAIANGVPAFQRPESRNAATTLTVMAAILATLFVGVTYVASAFGIVPIEEPVKRTVVSQVAAVAFGDASLGFYLFQAFTAMILILAANTSFNAFPRLGAILAQDGFMPRHFALRGDRLAFSLGIVMLSVIAAALVVIYGGNTHDLIPLYSVGVFIAFTIGQVGMIRHWRRERPPGWRVRLGINSGGALLTGIVAVVVLVAKAPQSLLIAVIIPALVLLMLFIERQYRHTAEVLEVQPDLVFAEPRRQERVVIPVPGLTRAVIQAVNFGRSVADDVQLVHITDDVEAGEKLRERVARQLPNVPFVIVETPFRSIVRPFVAYLDVTQRDPEALTIVILPEYVARHWWERLLYNQTTRRFREAVLGRPQTVVANVPYRREDPHPEVVEPGEGSTEGTTRP